MIEQWSRKARGEINVKSCIKRCILGEFHNIIKVSINQDTEIYVYMYIHYDIGYPVTHQLFNLKYPLPEPKSTSEECSEARCLSPAGSSNYQQQQQQLLLI